MYVCTFVSFFLNGSNYSESQQGAKIQYPLKPMILNTGASIWLINCILIPVATEHYHFNAEQESAPKVFCNSVMPKRKL